MNYNGNFNNISNTFFLIVLSIAIPFMVNVSDLMKLLIFALMLIGCFFYTVNYIYKIKISNNIIVKHFFLLKKDQIYDINSNNISNVIIALPSIKSYPIVRIFFKKEFNRKEIWFSTRNKDVMKDLYYYFLNNNINCEIAPSSAKKYLGIK